MVLYHGSRSIIETPIYGQGNKHNDYGLGFYCTESLELAKEWACASEVDGYANAYDFDISGLSVLHLSNGQYNILNWLAILLENRLFRISSSLAEESRDYIIHTFVPDYKNSDVIIGYRANDSYFSFANAFLSNTISLEQLESAMMLGELGLQIVVKSKNAFSRLLFKESYQAENAIYGIKYRERDNTARNEFKRQRDQKSTEDSIYMIDILRGRWENGDPRLRRIIFE